MGMKYTLTIINLKIEYCFNSELFKAILKNKLALYEYPNLFILVLEC